MFMSLYEIVMRTERACSVKREGYDGSADRSDNRILRCLEYEDVFRKGGNVSKKSESLGSRVLRFFFSRNDYIKGSTGLDRSIFTFGTSSDAEDSLSDNYVTEEVKESTGGGIAKGYVTVQLGDSAKEPDLGVAGTFIKSLSIDKVNEAVRSMIKS